MAGGLLAYCESTETDKGYFVVFFKCFADGFDGSVEGFFSVGLAELCFFSNGVDEFGLVHGNEF